MTILKSSEFLKKYGSFNHYDDARGNIGWKGKRGNNNSPKVLKGKEQVEISSDVWKQHLSDYDTKVKDEKKMEKYIFIDLGLSVYQKEKVTVVAPRPVTNNKKRSATQHLKLDESQTKKKKKLQDFFRAPSRLNTIQ